MEKYREASDCSYPFWGKLISLPSPACNTGGSTATSTATQAAWG